MDLPPELTDIIVDHLHDDVYALSACALTCRAWLPTVRFHRFHHTKLPTSRESTRQFHEVLLASPEVRDMVHTLELQGRLGWWLDDAAAWQGASYAFLTLLPAVVDLRLIVVTLEDSAHECSCRFRTFQLFVALIGSFPSLDTLTQSFALTWRYEIPSAVSPTGGLRTLRLGEPWFEEEDPRAAELVTAKDMLLRELHSKRTVHLAQRFLEMLGPDTLETLDLDISSAGGLLKILERESFSFASCIRLRTCTFRILLRGTQSLDNDDTVKLSLFMKRAKDVNIARRVSFNELQALNWAGVSDMFTQAKLLDRCKLVVEGEGEPAVLEDYIRSVRPELHARRVIQTVQYTAH
ncbi:uncharacterized protein B0H18DRAFT_975527 [Fomitopsis serialis]|uniref:uncharacterized protein n=1 Tax=Fomitopsis serialis TaxID=139415 RepID=UPI002007265B|nr:uncharacterized protein B0H18DRAFT_975527 [Neoantrodia serialis]KAH9935362.1 hypothetical protein B0H18DRAFT_975527 [Neoantrodia serialis]